MTTQNWKQTNRNFWKDFHLYQNPDTEKKVNYLTLTLYPSICPFLSSGGTLPHCTIIVVEDVALAITLTGPEDGTEQNKISESVLYFRDTKWRNGTWENN